jgi:hypothetical protein
MDLGDPLELCLDTRIHAVESRFHGICFQRRVVFPRDVGKWRNDIHKFPTRYFQNANAYPGR